MTTPQDQASGNDVDINLTLKRLAISDGDLDRTAAKAIKQLAIRLQQAEQLNGELHHDLKHIRQMMGCDGSDFEQLSAKWDCLQSKLAAANATIVSQGDSDGRRIHDLEAKLTVAEQRYTRLRESVNGSAPSDLERLQWFEDDYFRVEKQHNIAQQSLEECGEALKTAQSRYRISVAANTDELKTLATPYDKALSSLPPSDWIRKSAIKPLMDYALNWNPAEGSKERHDAYEKAVSAAQSLLHKSP